MIKKSRQLLFSRWHYILVDESELVSAIRVVNSCSRVPDAQSTFVRHAGLVNKPERWYISFTCYNREWTTIQSKLETTVPSVEILK